MRGNLNESINKMFHNNNFFLTYGRKENYVGYFSQIAAKGC